MAPAYKELVAPGTGERPLGKRYVDDSKVSDHHAIIPTTTKVDRSRLSDEERKLYDLVCRRLLMLWHDDYLQDVTTVVTAIRHEAMVDRYRTSGTVVRQMGWKVLDVVTEAQGKIPSRREPFSHLVWPRARHKL